MMRYVGGSRPDRALLGRDLLSRDADQGPIQGHGSGTFPWTRIRDISRDSDQGPIHGHGSGTYPGTRICIQKGFLAKDACALCRFLTQSVVSY